MQHTETKAFDIEQPLGIIVCVHCNEPLWSIKVLKHNAGKLISHEMRPAGRNTHGWDDKSAQCPLCKLRFYRLTSSKAPQYRMYNPITKQRFWL